MLQRTAWEQKGGSIMMSTAKQTKRNMRILDFLLIAIFLIIIVGSALWTFLENYYWIGYAIMIFGYISLITIIIFGMIFGQARRKEVENG
jgi:membrane protein YdbS with pleckstrin-like domain